MLENAWATVVDWFAAGWSTVGTVLGHNDAPDWAQAIVGAVGVGAALFVVALQNRAARSSQQTLETTKREKENNRGWAFVIYLMNHVYEVVRHAQTFVRKDELGNYTAIHEPRLLLLPELAPNISLIDNVVFLPKEFWGPCLMLYGNLAVYNSDIRTFLETFGGPIDPRQFEQRAVPKLQIIIDSGRQLHQALVEYQERASGPVKR